MYGELASRRRALQCGATLLGVLITAACGSRTAEPGTRGRRQASSMDPFDAFAPAGEKPDLPQRLAWANTSNAAFLLSIGSGMEAAAKARGLEFITAIADDNPERHVNNIIGFLQRGVGAIALQQIDPAAEQAPLEQAISSGVAVFTSVQAPATLTVTADQYQIGLAQGEAAGKAISREMDGKAKVVYFNSDTITLLKPRKLGVFDGLHRHAPNAEIVVDIQPKDFTAEAAANAMGTILQAHPDVDVVLGGDVFVLGALAEINARGKQRQIRYMSGVDGEQEALNHVLANDSPYRASFALPVSAVGYAWGQFAADWLEGKNIPQVILVKIAELSSPSDVRKFQAEMAVEHLTRNWNSSKNMSFRGNINYERRSNYLRDVVAK